MAYKLMQRGQSNLYYCSSDELSTIIDDANLEIGDRVYCVETDTMYYVGSNNLYDESGTLLQSTANQISE